MPLSTQRFIPSTYGGNNIGFWLDVFTGILINILLSLLRVCVCVYMTEWLQKGESQRHKTPCAAQSHKCTAMFLQHSCKELRAQLPIGWQTCRCFHLSLSTRHFYVYIHTRHFYVCIHTRHLYSTRFICMSICTYCVTHTFLTHAYTWMYTLFAPFSCSTHHIIEKLFEIDIVFGHILAW